MMQWQYSELWDYQLVSGLSVIFIGLFFLPLMLVSVVTAAVVRSNFKAWERRLRIVWSAASVLAGFFIIMGHAFNYQTANPLYVIPVWVLSGFILIALPLRARALLSGKANSGSASSSNGNAA